MSRIVHRSLIRDKKLFLTLFSCWILLNTSVKGQETSIVTELVAETKNRWLLTQIVDLDFEVINGDDIRLYVADFYSSPIFVLEKKGKRLKLKNRLGREGFGPGEFIEPTNVQIMQKGLLMVYDKNQTRITLISPHETTKPHTILLDPPKGGHYPMEVILGVNSKSDSVFFSRGSLFFSDNYNSNHIREVIYRAYSKGGKLQTDSVIVLPEDEPFVFIKNGSMSVNPEPWWGKKSIVRVKDGLIYTMWTGASELVIYDFDGQFKKKIALEIPKLGITEDDRRHSLDLEASLSDIKKSVLKPSYYKAMPRDYWPVAHDFQVDDKGYIWVALAANMIDKSRVWQVYNSEGGVVGRIKLPVNLTIHQIKENFIAGELFNFDNFNSKAQLYAVKIK